MSSRQLKNCFVVPLFSFSGHPFVALLYLRWNWLLCDVLLEELTQLLDSKNMYPCKMNVLNCWAGLPWYQLAKTFILAMLRKYQLLLFVLATDT